MPILKNAKHEAFARAVAEGKSGTQAYRENVAGSGTKTSTCMVEASRLLDDPKISLRLSELQKHAEQIAEKRFAFTKQKLISYLIEIAETPIGEVDEKHRLAQELSYDKQGRKQIKLPGKSDAAKQLAVLCGWNEAEKVDTRLEVVIKRL